MSDLIVISVKNTSKNEVFITLWRPNDCGYTAIIERAGRYSRDCIDAYLNFYNNGDNVVVPATVLESLKVSVPKGWFDYEGTAVMNIRANWKVIRAAIIAPTSFPWKCEPLSTAGLRRFNTWVERQALKVAQKTGAMA